jgi:hypothetical protein
MTTIYHDKTPTLLLGGMDSTQKVNIDQNCWIWIRTETIEAKAEAQHCFNISLIYLHGDSLFTGRIATSHSESVADPHHFDTDQDPNTSFHFKADPVPTFHSDADPYPASCQSDAKLRPLHSYIPSTTTF